MTGKATFLPGGNRMKKNVVSKDDLATILTVSEAASHLGRTFQDNFQRLTEKMFTSSSQASQDEKQSIVVRSPHAIDGGTLEESLKVLPVCIREKRSVDIVYRTGGKRQETTRTVDPYGLILHEGIWILIGFCNLRKLIRSFALDRVVSIQERNRYFTPRDDFNLDEYLSRTWGVIDGE
jgi:predicted DNA-binding transcriptional regulator YafY